MSSTGQFWGAYTLEVFSATTWGGLVRHRQTLTNVLYPALVRHDDDITADESRTCPVVEDSFLYGWNFAIDLYKMIEHLVDRSRQRKMRTGVRSVSPLDAIIDPFAVEEPSSQSMLVLMETMHANLPQVFKHVPAMTGDVEADCFGFQGG